MRDFSWRYFESTGEIDAYLLYREHQKVCGNGTDDVACTLEQDDDHTGMEL